MNKMISLFDTEEQYNFKPLAEKMRPNSLEEFFGQEDLTQDEEFYVDRDWAYSLLQEGEEEQHADWILDATKLIQTAWWHYY